MKKLMFVAAVAAAMTGVCEVSSQNVVGYLNKSAENANNSSWLISTFQRVDGTTALLKDFVIVEDQAQNNVHLKILSKTGKIDVDTDKGLKKSFIYVNPKRPGVSSAGWIPGWYYGFQANGTTPVAATEFVKGEDSAYWAGDVEIPYGTGFGIERAAMAATLIFNGQVASKDVNLSAPNANNSSWLGNCMPVDLKLKDFAIVEDQAQNNVHLKLLSKTGKIDVDTDKGLKKSFIYVNPNRPGVSSAGWIPGWYYGFQANGTTPVAATEFVKGNKSDYWAGDVDIPAGTLFGVERAAAGATVNIPSPLVDHTSK